MYIKNLAQPSSIPPKPCTKVSCLTGVLFGALTVPNPVAVARRQREAHQHQYLQSLNQLHQFNNIIRPRLAFKLFFYDSDIIKFTLK